MILALAGVVLLGQIFKGRALYRAGILESGGSS